MSKKSKTTQKELKNNPRKVETRKSFLVKPVYFIGALVVIVVAAVWIFIMNKPSDVTNDNMNTSDTVFPTQAPVQTTPGSSSQSAANNSPGQSSAGTQPSGNSPAFKPIDLSKVDPSQSPANDPNNPKVKRRESVNLVKDAKGQIIERTDQNFDKDGNVTMNNRYTYKYDEDGNMTEQRFYAHTPDGVQTANTVNFTKWQNKLKTENLFISYDQQGKEISRQKNTFKYNQAGQCVEDISYSANNKPMMKVEYIYQQGILRGERYTHYNPDGSVKNKESYDYDERGKIINK